MMTLYISVIDLCKIGSKTIAGVRRSIESNEFRACIRSSRYRSYWEAIISEC
jgi:hypothetical protein